MAQQKARKAGAQKRASKKYPKIVTTPSTADEIYAAYKFTPQEIRYAKRILDRVQRKSARASK
jgi:hypothetical protein